MEGEGRENKRRLIQKLAVVVLWSWFFFFLEMERKAKDIKETKGQGGLHGILPVVAAAASKISDTYIKEDPLQELRVAKKPNKKLLLRG